MVELRNVTKKFAAVAAVDAIDLIVQAGEFLTLLGPSGCGKTTLLRMIAGFEQPTEGSVWLDGRDVTADPPNKRNVNQVFQSYALFPHLNVWDNIAFGLRVKRIARPEIRERVTEAIRLVALPGMEKRKPDQLSGGQRQRVALARALVNRPKVLLLDEPLAALDAELRKTMQLELKKLQRSLGITFIFVTHDQDEALSMSDRIAVMNRGRIEQLGSAAEIYQQPKTSFVARFIGGGNVFECVSEGDQVRLSSGETVQVASGGGATAISIRPERVVLSRTPVNESNAFPVTIVEQMFRGAVDHLQVQTAGGLVINVVAEQGQWKRGDRAFATLRGADLIVLR